MTHTITDEKIVAFIKLQTKYHDALNNDNYLETGSLERTIDVMTYAEFNTAATDYLKEQENE